MLLHAWECLTQIIRYPFAMELLSALLDMCLQWSREETRVQFLDENYCMESSKARFVNRENTS